MSHKKVACNGCKRHPITETWHHCRACPDFDLCEKCFETRAKTHDKSHTWLARHTSEPSAKPAP